MTAFRLVLFLVAAVAAAVVAEAMVFRTLVALRQWWANRRSDRSGR